MAADLTTTGMTTVDLSDPSWSMTGLNVKTGFFNPVGTPLGLKVDVTQMNGGGSGPPPRPSSGFLYPRGDY